MKKIVTSYVNPPIPVCGADWCAYYDGDEELGNYGYGSTEEKAIQDLIDSYPEDQPIKEEA